MCLLLLTALPVEARSQYFDIPKWPGDGESCPAPNDIKSILGVFSAPAKTAHVDWMGVLPRAGGASVVAFEKAVFVLTEKNSETRGFLSSCIYATSTGKYLSMRLDAGNKHDEIVMWIDKSPSWVSSKDFSSTSILECADQKPSACGFFLK
jgi:hypothetical protein